MKQILWLVALWCGCTLIQAGADSSTGTGVILPPFTTVRLDNGMTALLMEKRDVPLIAFHGRVLGGDIADPEAKEGTAAITAELTRLGRNGVPVYALYSPGHAGPRLLSEILSVDEIRTALSALPST